jgi:ParB family transcriptional regulator, chromosome partitioning protein
MMSRKGGLGRGLGALIPGNDENEQGDASFVKIPINHIQYNPRQPRSHQDQDTLKELSASIQEHGILQPLIVRPGTKSGDFILISGERRLRAAKLAGLDEVPAIIRQANDEEQLELALIENVQRADLSPFETAVAYRQLNHDFGLSHQEIALRLGKSRVSVTNTLRLLNLPEQVLTALTEGLISEGHARLLLELATPQDQISILKIILDQGLSVRQTEDLVHKNRSVRPISRSRPVPNPEIKALEDRLRNRLSTKVNLTHGKDGGQLVIHYYSDEELTTIINIILED